ncbi:hypothetical protein [Aquimarina rubra]|uniref:Uncharacterized protein n=1 Tax=Aquimarina rubra TaxID=1920033 RepID=A0ABW5LE02_9FLAO
MKFDKLLSFIFGVKKSNFQITEQELEKISDKIDDNEEAINVDTTPLFNDSFEGLSDTIFKEATQKFKVNRYNYWAPKYTSLDSYHFLSEQEVTFKKDFTYWIVNQIIKFYTKKNISPGNQRIQYLHEVLNLLLRSNLDFKEEDFMHFIGFWEKSPGYITLGSLTSRLRQKVTNDGISDDLYHYLKKVLKHPNFHNEFYNYYKTPRNTIQRILHLYAKDNSEHQPSFLLISDPFADYINKYLINLNQKEQNAYCEILKTFETNKNFDNPFKLSVLIQKRIEDIGENAYKKQVLDFIKKASLFKPKMSNLRVEKVTYNTGYEVRYNCQYIKKENIAVLKSIILSIANVKNKKSAIPYLIKITERSFSNANAIRLGETSQSLGKLCIFTLAHHYEKKGKQELKNLYQETKYKSIKKQIAIEAEKLQKLKGITLL